MTTYHILIIITCLVTGGAGFIGSNLSRFLAVNGANVLKLDNIQYR